MPVAPRDDRCDVGGRLVQNRMPASSSASLRIVSRVRASFST